MNELRKTHIHPKATSTNRPCINNRNPNLFSNIASKTHNPICYNTTHRPARNQKLSKQLFRDGSERIKEFHELVGGAGVVGRKSVGDGLEAEPGVFLEAALGVGVTEEAAMDVIGKEEGDVDAGETE